MSNSKYSIYFMTVILLITLIFTLFGCNAEKRYTAEEWESISKGSNEQGTEKTITENSLTEKGEYEDCKVLWQMTIEKNNIYSDKNIIYILEFTNDIATLVAYEISSGKQVWKWEDQWESEGYIIGGDEDFLLLCRKDGRLYSISKADGDLLWKVNLMDTIGSFDKVVNMCSNNSSVFITIYSGGFNDFWNVVYPPYYYNIAAIDKKSGDPLWYQSNCFFCGLLLTPEEQYKTQQKSIELGNGFLDVDHYLEAISQKNVENIVDVSRNSILVMADKLMCLDSDTSDTLWVAEINNVNTYIENNIIYGLETILANDYFINRNFDSEEYAVRYDKGRYNPYVNYIGEVVAIDRSTGFEIWSTNNAAAYDLIELTDNNIYAIDNKLRAIGIEASEEVVWQLIIDKENGNYINIHDSARDFLGEFDGKALFSDSESGETGAVDFRNSETIWVNDDLILEDIIGIYNNVIIGYKENFIFGIDKDNGNRLWRITSDSDLDCFSVNENNKIIKELVRGLIIEDKCIFKTGNKIIILNATDGEKIKELEIQQDGISIISFSNTYIIFDDNYKFLYIKS